MTDEEAVELVLALLELEPGNWVTMRRNGRLLLALPPSSRAARKALRLYQPQRFKARATMAVLRVAAAVHGHRSLLPVLRHHGGVVALEPDFPRANPDSTGVLLGSAEHRVRRAIASYQTADGWEVAKVAFGPAGWEVIHGEAAVLASLPDGTPGAPSLRGVHRGADAALMRMPYVEGGVLKQGDSADAVALLRAWVSGAPAQPITRFAEWPVIEAALSVSEEGRRGLERLARLRLRPVVRHGDFARWNLLRTRSRGLMALDWEWGAASGMPGLDLVHLFAQDARLVERLTPGDVVRSAGESLRRADCQDYLNETGWEGDARAAILASIAFTIGARQQANEAVLAALLEV
jgi:hypothetical protein